jgi:hypothetical protein
MNYIEEIKDCFDRDDMPIWLYCIQILIFPPILTLWHLILLSDLAYMGMLCKYYDLRGIKYYRQRDKFGDIAIRL